MKKLQNICGPLKQINKSTYRINVVWGANITDTIAEAIDLVSNLLSTTKLDFNNDGMIAIFERRLDTTMQFDFNGVTVSVRSDSNPELIYRDWSRSLSGYIGKSVGPNPNPVLTDEEKASDARVEAKNELRRQEESGEVRSEGQGQAGNCRGQAGRRAGHRARRRSRLAEVQRQEPGQLRRRSGHLLRTMGATHAG